MTGSAGYIRKVVLDGTVSTIGQAWINMGFTSQAPQNLFYVTGSTLYEIGD
jgi:hypothetical protein